MDSLKHRFQFLVTIVLFFPVLLDALLKQTNTSTNLPKVIISWGVVVGVLILDYILLELIKYWSFKSTPKWINISFFAILGSFAVILLIIAGSQQFGELSIFLYYILALAFGIVLYTPILILAMLMVNLIAFEICSKPQKDSLK